MQWVPPPAPRPRPPPSDDTDYPPIEIGESYSTVTYSHLTTTARYEDDTLKKVYISAVTKLMHEWMCEISFELDV